MLPRTAPETSLGRVRAAVFDRISSVRSPRFWRVLYWLLARRATVAVAARLLRMLDAVRPGARAAALARAGELLVQSGWPNQSPGWVNLDTARFVSRVSHRRPPRHRVQPRPIAPASGRKLRMGLLGEFGRPLIFSAEHFAQLPRDVETSVFDIAHSCRHAPYLADHVAAYAQFGALQGADRADEVARVARAVNDAELDLIVFISGPGNVYALIDAIDTPCVGFATLTSNLVFHDRVGFQIYCQPQADYFFRDGELFCGLSRAPFREQGVVPGFLLLGSRGFQPAAAAREWRERDPLIVYHGSLYKANSRPYLDAVLGLLQEDAALEFAFMGRDDGMALDAILGAARAHGVESRVHYEGSFSLVRTDDGGTIADAGWRQLTDLLSRARLAPDPWPMGGAGARVEAYGLGAPTAHMAVRFDTASWGTRQHAVIEIPRLLVPEATATTPTAYREICRRCLHDGDFASRVAAAQAAAVERLLDAAEYWRQLPDAYDAWQRRRADA